MASSGQATPAFVRLASHPLRWQLLTELADSDYRVRELVTLVDQPQSLVSYHLRLLHNGGLVTARRSSFDGRDSYYNLDLQRCALALAATGAALHPALRPDPLPPAANQSRPTGVLFLCTGNSARSPIAETLLREYAPGQVEVTSAGSHPKQELHSNTVRVLREEYGVDVADQRPRHLNTVAGRRFDYVISMCDKVREVCPEFPDHPRRAHWSIPDPAAAAGTDKASYPTFQRAAADIATRINYLLPILARTPHQEIQP
jgi:ArsR family transcriptional regulator, arsenate/arsenite/antimonite-responsive transcriptional repressor / arsenate reductase (thioredoxin)